MSRTKLAAIAIGLAAAAGLGAALAYATTNDGGSITACVDRDGTPRIVTQGAACKKHESPLAWAVQGPPGPTGPKGDQGAKGEPGASGHTLTAIGNMTLKGRNGQPILGGDGTATSIDLYRMSSSIVSPRDAASGQPTGKRMHKPFVITKAWDASTPLLMQACSNNEVIPQVTFHFFAPGSTVENVRMTLLDASCAEISHTSDADNYELEDISFTYRRIEVEHLVGKTMYMDDWTTTSG